MTKATPIKATFAHFAILKTRGQAQFVFEVPMEQADEALKALGGLPQAAKERWAAIVLLDLNKPESAATTPKERRKFDTLPLPQQAALLCSNEAFKRFLAEESALPFPVNASDEDAANVVRKLCGIQSRAELATNDRAAGKFMTLQIEYENWLRVPT